MMGFILSLTIFSPFWANSMSITDIVMGRKGLENLHYKFIFHIWLAYTEFRNDKTAYI